MSDDTPATGLEAALAATAGQDIDDALLLTLAVGEFAVPNMSADPERDELTLPFIERLGIRYALVFTSRQRVEEFGLESYEVVTMTGELLGAAWPLDEDVWLAIDAASDHGAMLSPEKVRSLRSMAGTG
ncbi:SseB protein N-terminal domain-containing protein [Haloechinothrix alba]|uniref:SseB protein N-terminal domain-containing protein n=1 Tax=Haloechinothrix alba TaxID=664784 RepID=A0A238VL00_9PSEU|nr:SseB family protein [Haloechinothrix alba]SNR34878.1 SseB protein N-terminal domain-containing protein [Haloechinothrix alba]